MINLDHLSRDAITAVFPSDDLKVLDWLENQSESAQQQLAYGRLVFLIKEASQHRNVSGNACLKLCHFVERCRKSKSIHVQKAINSNESFESIFEFYLQWSERNRNKSMRLVLEVLSSLFSLRTADEKTQVLENLLNSVTREAASHSAKSAFKCLDCFLGKGNVSFEDLMVVYGDVCIRSSSGSVRPSSLAHWELFISDMFSCLALPDVAPAAAKFLITTFAEISRGPMEQKRPLLDRTSLWQLHISRGLEKFPGALESVKNYLFPPLFKSDIPGSLIFLRDLNDQMSHPNLYTGISDSSIILCLAALGVGKKVGLVGEPTLHPQNKKEVSNSSILLHEDSVGILFGHQLGDTRFLSFSVLVSSSSSIRPFSAKALEILKLNMWILYADTDSKNRSDTLGTMKILIERLRGATSNLYKDCQKANPGFDLSKLSEPNLDTASDHENVSLIENLLKAHTDFVEWFQKFLSDELASTTSYQRHIMALKTVNLFVRSGIFADGPGAYLGKNSGNATSWPFKIHFFTPLIKRLLYDLVLDPFEDVRIDATSILKLFCPSLIAARKLQGSFSISEEQRSLSTTLARANDISEKTGRADAADGVARLHELQYYLVESPTEALTLLENLVGTLESKVGLAKSDLARAVLEAPVHGIFASLNLIWGTVNQSKNHTSTCLEVDKGLQRRFENLQNQILSCCYQIWDAVREILCSDSPEGYLPEIDETTNIDTKDVLSYSFRAVHESSLLIRTLIGEPNPHFKEKLLSVRADVFDKATNLSYQQLANLRHRGAFSTVSLTFAKLCQLAQREQKDGQKMAALLKKYLENAFTCLLTQPSTTRRSAGLPMLIAGILSAITQTTEFINAVQRLKLISQEPIGASATDETHYPQVHALNCLRHIFQSSSLSPYVESEIEQCLEIAANCQISSAWAVRNAGQLLLRSLVDRLLGTQEDKSSVDLGWDGESVVIAYECYPELAPLLLKLLKTNVSSQIASDSSELLLVESVFPALDIIRRAGPPHTCAQEIKQAVLRCLGSDIWSIRELAARTAAALFACSKWNEIMAEKLGVIGTAATEITTNQKHGVFLTIKFIIERKMNQDVKAAVESLKDFWPYLKRLEDVASSDVDLCPFLCSAREDIRSSVYELLLAAVYHSEAHIEDEDPFLGFDPSKTNFFNRMLSKFEKYRRLFTSSKSLDLLWNAIIRGSIYGAGITGDTECIRKIVKYILKEEPNSDIVVTALQAIAVACRKWSMAKPFDAIIDAYVWVITESTSAEVRSIALKGLSEALGKKLQHLDLQSSTELLFRDSDTRLWLSSEIIEKAYEIGALLRCGKTRPSLTNSEILASGPLLLLDLVRKHCQTARPCAILAWRVREWGNFMVAINIIDIDFDARWSAAQTLDIFFSKPYFEDLEIDKDCLLPALLSLYDLLNDDDDEIRDLAAQTVSSTLKRSMMPLAAQKALIEYLTERYSDQMSFSWNLICRVTGNHRLILASRLTKLLSASVQFNKALEINDALFMQEKQNLFIDEVRETKQWIYALTAFLMAHETGLGSDILGSQTIVNDTFAALANWTLDGLLELNRLVMEYKNDGPLGWTSKSDVFTICMRVLLCSTTLVKRRGQIPLAADPRWVGGDIMGVLEKELDRFMMLGRASNIHPLLLSAANDRNKL